MEMNTKPGAENKIHFFHHDTGGVFRLDISPLGCILVVNQTGIVYIIFFQVFLTF